MHSGRGLAGCRAPRTDGSRRERPRPGARARHGPRGPPVQLEHGGISSADDEQRRSPHSTEARRRQIGPSAARHDPRTDGSSAAAQSAAAAPVLAPK